MAIDHADATGIHPAAFVGETDPANDAANKVAVGKLWIDTSGGQRVIKLRESVNSPFGQAQQWIAITAAIPYDDGQGGGSAA